MFIHPMNASTEVTNIDDSMIQPNTIDLRINRVFKSHIAVKINKRLKKYLNFLIHNPGFGKNDKIWGFVANIIYGLDNPKLMQKKIKKIIWLGLTNANPIAVPIKGAEHGVDKIVIKDPRKKFWKNSELFLFKLIIYLIREYE